MTGGSLSAMHQVLQLIISPPAAAKHKRVLAVGVHHVQHALQRIHPCNPACSQYTCTQFQEKDFHTLCCTEVRHLHLAYIYPLNPREECTHVSHDSA